MNDASPAGPNRAAAAVLFLCTLFLYSYHINLVAYDNAASRADLAFAAGLHGNFSIDEYHTNTIDKAFFEGHHYSDKAPGLSLAAAPVVWILSRTAPLTDWHPDDPFARYPLVLLLVSLPSAFAVLLVAKTGEIVSGRPAYVPAMLYGAATVAAPYASLFYSHQFSAALLVAAFYLWLRERTGLSGRTFGGGFLCGLLAGYAAISEYPAAVPAVAIVAMSFIQSRRGSHRAGLAAGFIVPLCILAWYNTACFGHPLRIGYFYETHEWFDREMSRGLGGVTFPRPRALFNLLFEPFRGLLWGQVFLFILAVPGTAFLWRAGGARRNAGVAACAFFIAALLVNAGYYEPYGGFGPGPRFMVWSLPFLAILAAAGWGHTGPVTRGVTLGTGIFYIAYYQVIAGAGPQVPHIFRDMFFDYSLPAIGITAGYINFGKIAGLPGILTVVPAVAAGVAAVIFLLRTGNGHRGFVRTAAWGLAGIAAITVVFRLTAPAVNPDPVENRYYSGISWYAKGIARFKVEQYNEAIKCFEEAVRSDPANEQVRVSLVAALATQGNIAQAISVLDESLDMFPENKELGNLRRKLEEIKKPGPATQ